MLKDRLSAVEDRVTIRNVIISVSDKSGLDTLVLGLRRNNPSVAIYSTGGTYRRIKEILGPGLEAGEGAGLVEIAEYTGQPEMEGGLVKSLDFHVHAGILAEPGNEDHRRFLADISAVYFDLVVVNLYPFEETVARSGSDLEDGRGNIDIGGPTMLRAAAKNFLRVATVTNPRNYQEIVNELRRSGGSLSLATRLRLAQESFAETSRYEAAISGYFSALNPEIEAERILGRKR